MADPTERHIVAMGGGGFSMEPENPLLDDFALSLTERHTPRVCFVPTASGDAPLYVERFYYAFPPGRAAATHLRLFQRDERNLRVSLLDQDVIYIGGGSTANMLAVWRLHGVDRILREAWEGGTVLAGVSAGANCWFEASITDSFGPPAPLGDGLDLLSGSCCPHYDGEPDRRPAYHRMLSEGGLPGGIALDDGAAAHFTGGRLREVVCSRPAALGYRVRCEGGRVVEETLPTRRL